MYEKKRENAVATKIFIAIIWLFPHDTYSRGYSYSNHLKDSDSVTQIIVPGCYNDHWLITFYFLLSICAGLILSLP